MFLEIFNKFVLSLININKYKYDIFRLRNTFTHLVTIDSCKLSINESEWANSLYKNINLHSVTNTSWISVFQRSVDVNRSNLRLRLCTLLRQANTWQNKQTFLAFLKLMVFAMWPKVHISTNYLSFCFVHHLLHCYLHPRVQSVHGLH